MDDAVKDLYLILLKYGGRVKHIMQNGNMYLITTERPVTYQNGVTKKESTSEYLERMMLKPCRKKK
jgi:hypothetical protein